MFGIAYRVAIVPKKFTSIVRYRSLAQIPGSKEMFISIAWAVSTGLIPFLGSSESSLSSLPVVLAFTFSMVFIRTVLLDVRDVQGDRIIGKETIPIVIGKNNTKAILVVMSILLTSTINPQPCEMGGLQDFPTIYFHVLRMHAGICIFTTSVLFPVAWPVKVLPILILSLRV